MRIEPHQRVLELRRHAERTKPGEHLSQAGIDRARAAGSSGLPFSRVVTSPSPRAVQTAVAMGSPVDQEEPLLQTFGSAVSALIAWDCGFRGWHEGVAASPVLAAFATLQAATWHHVLSTIPPGQAALIITHGGMIEAGVMAMAPTLDWSTAGAALGYAEGVRLWFEGDHCTQAVVLRFPGDHQHRQTVPPLPSSPTEVSDTERTAMSDVPHERPAAHPWRARGSPPGRCGTAQS